MTSLKAMRTALEQSGSEHAAQLISLIDKGKISPYPSRPGSQARQRFGSSGTSFPQLGKKMSFLAAGEMEPIQDLREKCLRDLTEPRDEFEDRQMYFSSSRGSQDNFYLGGEVAVTKIIENLGTQDATLETAENIVVFQSETLDDIRCDGFLPPENLLHVSMTTFALLPSDTLLPLQHSNEGTTTSTLVSGLMFWVIWPRTEHNMQALQTAYNKFADDLDEAKLDISQDLEGGVILLQCEGEGLRIPPFSPMISFAAQTSVLATYSTVTIEDFISALQRGSFLRAFFRTELEGERKQNEFNGVLLQWLDYILNQQLNSKIPIVTDLNRDALMDGKPLTSLLHSWDRVKDELAMMMSPANAQAVQDIWSTFLIRSKGRECKLCGKRISNKQKLMRKHFVGKHWPKEVIPERIDSMDAADVGVDEIDGTIEVVKARGNKA